MTELRNAAAAALLAALLAVLAGCTSAAPRAPSARGTAAPARQPLQRLQLAVPASEGDGLAHLLAGDFALAGGDLATAAREYLAAARLTRDPAVAEQALRYAVAAKDLDAARAARQRWRELAPEAGGLGQADATLALASGDADAALAALLRLAVQPEGKGWRGIGQVLLGGSDKALAGSVLERLLAAQRPPPGQAELWIAMSQLAFKLDRRALAHDLAAVAERDFGSAEALGWSAQLAAEEGDKARARERYAAAVRKAPQNTRLRSAYAALLAEGGDNAGAARVLAQGPQDDYTWAARAAYAARAEDRAQLNALYDELASRNERERAGQASLLGQLAELLERKEAAMGWYQQVAEDSPRWFEAQLRIAVLLDGSGKAADALGLARELQARAGEEPRQLADAFLLEAELLSHRGEDEAAIAAYARGLASLPDDTRLLYGRALLNANLGHGREAENDLRRVLQFKPDDVDAMNALGYTLADDNRLLDEALGLIERALKTKPEEPAVIDSYGWVQFRLGHLVEAEQALRRAFGKQPDAEIAAHLGEVLWHSGQRDEARRVFEQGRKKDAKNKTLLDAMRRLGA